MPDAADDPSYLSYSNAWASQMTLSRQLTLAAALFLTGCDSGKTDAEFRSEIMTNLNQLMVGKVQALSQAAHGVQDAAPRPADRGWDGALDRQSVATMKEEWGKMRDAWESTEGIIAPLFPNLDETMDSRYEDMLSAAGAEGDPNLFDGQVVIGMHAVERVIYAPEISSDVVEQEKLLPGYVPAAWPATAEEAQTLKAGLCMRLVSDTQMLVTGWMPEAIVLDSAFEGLTKLMDEQKEKVNLARGRQDESRYAQRTLADLRKNLEGTRTIYALFNPWLTSKPGGSALDSQVQASFARLGAVYDAYPGENFPQPAATSDPSMPLSPQDQQTDFGMLYLSVLQEVDPSRPDSIVDSLNEVAKKLDLPQFVPEQ